MSEILEKAGRVYASANTPGQHQVATKFLKLVARETGVTRFVKDPHFLHGFTTYYREQITKQRTA